MKKFWALPVVTIVGVLGAGPLVGAAYASDPYLNTPTQSLPVPPCTVNAGGTGSTTTTSGGTGTGGSTYCAPTTVLGASGTPPVVSSSAPVTAPTGVAPATSTSTGSLPFTGAEIGTMSGLAVGAIAVGGAMVLAARRRRQS